MCYSLEPRDIIYIKHYEFLSFAKNISENATKVGENMRNKYSQKILDSAKKFGADSIKTASERAIYKAAEQTDNLIGDRITDEITSVSK